MASFITAYLINYLKDNMNFQRRILILFLLISTTSMLCNCVDPSLHQQNLRSTHEREMTVGIVQKEIRQGMSQADVAASIGSPNIVTKDSSGKETWVYDKIATEASYSRSNSGISGSGVVGGLAGSTLLLGGIGGGYSQSSGSASTTQKTLTVIIKFNDKNLVDSFTYHTSKF